MLKDFKAYQFALEYHKACSRLTLPAYLRDQLQRASASVALNLAEGSGRFGKADQRRFYSIALGSLRECEAVLSIHEVSDPALLELQNKLGGFIFRLCRANGLGE